MASWVAAWLLAGAGASPGEDLLLEALELELERTMEAYEGQEGAPYYLGYRVADQEHWKLSARYGALGASSTTRRRTLDVSARVGSPALDSTHQLKGGFVSGLNLHTGHQLPLDAEPRALRAAIWVATHKEVRDAQERWARVQTNQQVKVEDRDPSPDFSDAEPVVALGPHATLSLHRADWEDVLVELSQRLDAAGDEIHASEVSLDGIRETQWIVTSEGARIRQPREWVRISMQAWSRTDDGMKLQLYRWRDVHDPDRLPDAAELQGWAGQLARDLIALRGAEEGDAYHGPVLLRGKAAGVFVHEVLGHRVEGHRQKDDDEGQTFTDKIGQQLLPSSIDVYDDPTLASYAGEDLNGYYRYDQEGIPAQRAVLVEDGVFVGFLMSRSPIEGFGQSNGHGRAQAWRQPVARMANTVVETDDPHTEAQLRAMLRRELREQGREWGLMIDEIGGGFTLTGRLFPNAFNVRATYGHKVFADGRPDELVRGIDLVGTPLVALSNVVAAGDDPQVFNGFCGAESGVVPNSTVAPPLLIRQLEIQKKETGADRPPLLPKPAQPGGDT